MLSALSPLDGRYAKLTEKLRPFFSEQALIRARIFVEISYLVALSEASAIRELPRFKAAQQKLLWKIVSDFTQKEAEKVKALEKKTNHDVKAVEYYLREKIKRIPGLKNATAFLHFALTSEDVNNLAYGMLIHEAREKVLLPDLTALLRELSGLAKSWRGVKMLSLTHGQPATPTTVGSALQVFVSRLTRQLAQLKTFRMQGKLGGAVGNLSAHKAAYPEIRWEVFRDRFVRALGLDPLKDTTQINPHDDIAELSHLMQRINSILLNLSRDMWMYISRGVFRQKIIAGEVGSSTMPHKVNPIEFEMAEGNAGLSNALFAHFAEKLPVSRLQRDLSDSTVQRSIGSAFGYHTIAVASLQRGLAKLSLDEERIAAELAAHPEVAAEAIQTVLRKHGVENAYERLKALTRGENITKEQIKEFVQSLKIPKEEKKRLLRLL